MALGARESAQGHNPTATQEVAKASEADVILQLDIKLTSLFHVRVAPQPPYDKVGVAPPMRHDILCIAIRIGNNIAKVGARGEEHGS